MNAAMQQKNNLAEARHNLFENLRAAVPRDRVDRAAPELVIDRVDWLTVAEILDATFPEWSSFVRDVRQVGGLVAVTVALTIAGVTREGIGTGRADSEDGVKRAEQQGLKAAAVLFGIGRETILEFETQEAAAVAPPEKPQLELLPAPAAVESPVVGDAPASEPETAPAEDMPPASEQEKLAAEWRRQIEKGMREIAVDPTNALQRYDVSMDTFLKKKLAFDETQKYLTKEKTKMIKRALAAQPWSDEEISRELEKFGIANGLDFAVPEQIAAIWSDYRRTRML